ncbi:hypothetical protein BDY24DRAFT_437866 [Mrakia frigida]|uniref:uncharacterized protein n=1 Tax=Mrakia frigida TaxID=29902 RepID=UPI003FCBF692
MLPLQKILTANRIVLFVVFPFILGAWQRQYFSPEGKLKRQQEVDDRAEVERTLRAEAIARMQADGRLPVRGGVPVGAEGKGSP